MNIETYQKKYLEYLKLKNYSLRTIENKDYQLSDFIRWCGERSIEDIKLLNKSILQRYQKQLYYHRKANDKPLSIRNQYNRLMTLRGFFKWLYDQGYIITNPMLEIELPKLNYYLPHHILTTQEINKILAKPDIHSYIGLRDKAILELLYSTGIRRGEAVNIKI